MTESPKLSDFAADADGFVKMRPEQLGAILDVAVLSTTLAVMSINISAASRSGDVDVLQDLHEKAIDTAKRVLTKVGEITGQEVELG